MKGRAGIRTLITWPNPESVPIIVVTPLFRIFHADAEGNKIGKGRGKDVKYCKDDEERSLNVSFQRLLQVLFQVEVC